jgi:hypothetical protein
MINYKWWKKCKCKETSMNACNWYASKLTMIKSRTTGMQVNLRWWRAGGQKEEETEQLCEPYLSAMFNCGNIVYCERWIEVQIKCAFYKWMRRKTTKRDHIQ